MSEKSFKKETLVGTPSNDRSASPTEQADRKEWSSPDVERGQSTATQVETGWPTGWRPYAALTACFMLMFNSWGYVNAFGTFATLYHGQIIPGQGYLNINAIGGIEILCILGFSCITGRLVDASHQDKVLTVGTVFLTAGMFAQASVRGDLPSRAYNILVVTQGVLGGIGMSCFFVTSSQVAGTWFKAKKALALGIVACGASVGGAIYSTVLKYLELELGYMRAVLIIAAIMAATCIAIIFFAGPKPTTEKHPKFLWRIDTFWDKHALQNSAFVWFSAGFALMFMGFYPIFFALEPWATLSKLGWRGEVRPEELPRDTLATFALLAIMNATSFTGRPASATLSQYVARYRSGALHVHVVVNAIGTILVFCMWPFVITSKGAIAFVVLFGIFSGAIIGLPAASVAHIIGNHNDAGQKKLGQWVGMMYTMAAVPGLAGALICGKLADVYPNTFLPVMKFCGTSLAIATICMAIGAWYKYQNEKREVDLRPRMHGLESSSTTMVDQTG
ncbi:hypothetical protein LTR78_002818 [Recurvomyces mirabilis]|uniref:Uncharacterized protein n=1 Tax=Recurvomyces mirabilis TaxID=574656 RepID=A0AAE0WSI5_9PEZI|nr:hypothetical protein LTR78_002818 [Recurvomyces mirabilis]KAK5159449.1 hypothetical protein LTS14_002591 [Recurvomyces mirabilis]